MGIALGFFIITSLYFLSTPYQFFLKKCGAQIDAAELFWLLGGAMLED